MPLKYENILKQNTAFLLNCAWWRAKTTHWVISYLTCPCWSFP